MNRFYQSTAFILRCYYPLFYRLSVYGADQPLKGKAIFAPNHVSYYDPTLIASAWPEEIHFLARSGLFRNKIWAKIFTNLNAHPVQEDSMDIGSLRKANRILEAGKKIVIFPEGERTLTGDLQPIKPGIAMLAMRSQCPIIPVYIGGAYETWPRKQLFPKFFTHLSCVFGKPIYLQPNDNRMGNGEKKKRQEEISQQIKARWENLRQWLENGAQGEIP